RGLRCDAGWSAAAGGQRLGYEAPRVRIRERFRAPHDRAERRALVSDGIVRIGRQIATLRGKIERIEAMIRETETRRAHLQDHLPEIDAERTSTPAPARRGSRR